MIVNAIVACTPNGIIGVNGKMPWHCSEDLKRFKRITTGHPVIMGRKTWQSIGAVLPGRLNVVITREYTTLIPPRYVAFESIEAALDALRDSGYPEVFIIGGQQLYEAAEPYLCRIYKTVIDTTPKIWVGDEVTKWTIQTDTGWALAYKDVLRGHTNFVYTRRNTE